MARPKRGKPELETGKKSVASIGNRGVEKFGNRPFDIHDEIVVVGFAPIKAAAVPKFNADGKIGRGRPIGADVAIVKDCLLKIVSHTISDSKRRKKKLPRNVGFGKSAM